MVTDTQKIKKIGGGDVQLFVRKMRINLICHVQREKLLKLVYLDFYIHTLIWSRKWSRIYEVGTGKKNSKSSFDVIC